MENISLKLSSFWLAVFLLSDISSAHILQPTIEGRILNGSLAAAENNTHHVSIRLKNQDWYFGAGHTCGGSIIAPTVILTAARCLFDTDTQTFISAHEFRVVMGSLNRFDLNNSLSFDVTYYKVHDYNPDTAENDIALLFLDGVIPSNLNHIQKIDLTKEAVADDTMCTTSGWGITEKGERPEYLLSVDVPIVSQTTCAQSYRTDLKPGMLCAGYLEGGQDACTADSGGPLVCNGKLAGVVSHRDKCGRPNQPGIYSDVSLYHDWIKKESGSGTNSLKLSIAVLFAAIFVKCFV